ncbi:hypothetical protein LTR35_007835 [Friedmanniomyces endolithicus]|nr:hypothetical protein LTR35_007835 [Friedmanniomyces endolithicus]KAK0282551.1 hypothetical protein LTS00_012063 [Friedmanniomyces endolithicus]KAK1006812.1 hypothetical protein LTR54_006569 [Friedmanniomyces endolithicus]
MQPWRSPERKPSKPCRALEKEKPASASLEEAYSTSGLAVQLGQALRRLEAPKHQPDDPDHTRSADRVGDTAARPPVHGTERQRAERAPKLPETAMVAQFFSPLLATRLETRQAVEPRHDRAARDGQQRGSGVEPAFGCQLAEDEERRGAADDAELHDAERVHASDQSALKDAGHEADVA